MDVFSLLNSGSHAQANQSPFEDSSESATTPAALSTDGSTAPTTPSPTGTPQARRKGSDSRLGFRSRTPWDAGGYSLPLTLDTKLFATRTPVAIAEHNKPPSYQAQQSLLSPDVPSSTSGHSRAGSVGSSFDMVHSAMNTPLTSCLSGRMMFSDGDQQAEEKRPEFESDNEAQLTARRQSFVVENVAQMHGSTSPKSPKHKCSDSHSSFSSSYASSLQSGGHSRISSMSTVSGIQPLGTILSDGHSVEGSKPTGFPLSLAAGSQSTPMLGDVHPPSPRTIEASSSPANSRPGVSPSQDAGFPPMEGAMRSHDRPGSPSDVFLMGGRKHSGSDSISPQKRPSNLLPLIPENHIKTHKRAISAPDFAAISAPFRFPSGSNNSFQHSSGYMTVVPIPESPSPTGDSANHGDSSKGVDYPWTCYYMNDCQTGSTPRKAISHIFGRNKTCTRMIPGEVWVHFCRKHYQRTRYRNAHEYAKQQMELVKAQIDKLDIWSEENRKNDKPGVVQSWAVAVRKREQKRIEKRKRSLPDSEEDAELQNAEMNGTAVPSWLLEKIGQGYDTEAIRQIVDRISAEIESGVLPQVPDVEFLPNIKGDGDSKPKTASARRRTGSIAGNNTFSAAHKRSQSMGVSRPEALSMTRHSSQQSTPSWSYSRDSLLSPKRIRRHSPQPPVSSPYQTTPGYGQVPAPRTDRVVPMMTGARFPIPYPPLHETARDGDNYQFGRSHSNLPSLASIGGPLPAPMSHKQSITNGSSLEISLHGTSNSRPTHQRSHSEFSFNPNSRFGPSAGAGHSQPSYMPAPIEESNGSDYSRSDYPRSANEFHPSSSLHQGRNYGAEGQSATNGATNGYYPFSGLNQASTPLPPPSSLESSESSSPVTYRHTRHQSTPTAAPILSRSVSSGYPLPPLSSSTAEHFTQSPTVSRTHSYPQPSFADAPPAGMTVGHGTGDRGEASYISRQ